jgi:predicted enzyme related to lactoylglutathione lyase
MPTRDTAPLGAPCWTDLWTSDVQGARRFYSELFGWEALEADPAFGGYFMWTCDGTPVAGGMGDMGDAKADNAWKVYLQTPDVSKTAQAATEKGAELAFPPSPVADLGMQMVLQDPTGATVGAWQPGTFQGFAVTGEPGAPSWFELHTSDYALAVDFYGSVFQWQTAQVSDTDEFRYSVMLDPGFQGELAGVMDARNYLNGARSTWFVYWQVRDVGATVTEAERLGGSVAEAPMDTPYGTLATLVDPAGARFKLRTPPQA